MHWQEACLKSQFNKAYRINKHSRNYTTQMIRFSDGGGYRLYANGGTEKLPPEETEGHLDWEPY